MAVVRRNGHFLIRYATIQDYEAVLTITKNAYDGTDFVPALYNQYLSDPKTRPYILQIGGDVAGFMVCTVVDGGKTVITQAIRIKKVYRGQAHFREFAKTCTSDIKHHFPSVNEVISAAFLSPYEQDNISVKVQRSTILQIDGAVILGGNESEISIHGKDCGGNMIRQLQSEELQSTLLKNREILGQYISVTFQPYRITDHNISYIINTLRPVCFVSEPLGAKVEGSPQAFGGISLSTSFESLARQVIFMSYKGNRRNDIASHLLYQLDFAKRNVLKEHQNFYIYIIFPKEIPYGEVFRAGFQLGLSPTLQDLGITVVQVTNRLQEVLDKMAKL